MPIAWKPKNWKTLRQIEEEEGGIKGLQPPEEPPTDYPARRIKRRGDDVTQQVAPVATQAPLAQPTEGLEWHMPSFEREREERQPAWMKWLREATPTEGIQLWAGTRPIKTPGDLAKAAAAYGEAALWMFGPIMPSAAAGWKAAATLPKPAMIAARTALAPLVGAEKAVALPFKGVGALVRKGVTALEAKFEAHRIANILGMTKKAYQKLAKEVTGKTSMTTMNEDETVRFLTALQEKHPTFGKLELPIRGVSTQTASKRVRPIAQELAASLGGPKEVPELAVKGIERTGFFAGMRQKTTDFISRTDLMDRIMWKADKFRVGKLRATFIDTMDDAAEAELLGRFTTEGGLRDLVKRVGLTWSGLMSKQRTLLLPDIALSLDERLAVYIYSKNAHALRHLQYGNFGKFTAKYGEDYMKTIIKAVEDSLSPQEKQIADYMLQYANKQGAGVAQVFKELSGKALKLEGNYFPRKVVREAEVNLDPVMRAMRSEYAKRWPSVKIAKEFTIPISPSAKQEINLDTFEIFARHVREIEHFKAFSLPMRDLQRIYANPVFKRAFIDRVGEGQYKTLKHWLDVNAMTDPLRLKYSAEKYLRVLRGNATTGALGLNITVSMKQFPSLFNGMAVAGEMPILRGLLKQINPQGFKETLRLIKTLSPEMHNRVMMRELAEMQTLKGATAGKLNWRQIFMILTTTVDKFTAGSVWRGSYDDALRGITPKIANLLNVSEKTTMTEKLAARYATRVVKKTQPFFNPKEVPELWTSGEGWRMLTMFQNQLNRNWNFLRYDVIGARQVGAISTKEALRRFTEAIVVPALIIGWISRSRPAQNIGEAAHDLAFTMVAEVPAIGQFISGALQGYSGASPITFEAFERMQRLTQQVQAGKVGPAALTGLETAGFLRGVPVVQLNRTVRGILDLAQGKTDDWLRLIWSEYARKKAGQEAGGQFSPAPTKGGIPSRKIKR